MTKVILVMHNCWYHRPRRKPSSFFPANLLNLLPGSLLSVATRGVFLSTQLLAILVGIVFPLCPTRKEREEQTWVTVENER